MGFLSSGVLGLNVSGNFVEVVRAKKDFSNLNILKWKTGFFVSESEVEGILSDVGYDIEDTVVVNLPMDFVVFMTFDVAPGMKRKELRNYGNMMASRNLGISSGDIAVDVLSVVGNRGIFMIARKDNLRKAVSNLMGMGFPEPDVVIPDLVKYVYLTTIPNMGELLMVVVNFLQNYMAILVFSGGKVISVRITTLDLMSVFDAIQDQFGFTKEEILVRSSLRDLKEPYDFLLSSFENLVMELERETTVALRDGIVQLDISAVDVKVVFVEPISFEDALTSVMMKSEIFKDVKSSYRPGLNLPEGVLMNIREALGLLIRGGLEFGKVKLVRIKG